MSALRQQLRDKLSKDKITFPPAPCAWLCDRVGIMKRFHLTCLTCPIRRLFFRKHGHQKWTRYKQVVMVLESASGKGFVMPKRYMSYGVIIPLDPETGNANMLKAGILKVLLTIAERIAEW